MKEREQRIKVLAADDEYWSRENIRNLIPWEKYSMEFLEPACDGEEVLERIGTERPDILLTDINMPFLSGLELLGQISQKYPEIITVAISGYDDFEKVKGVFIAGGIDYLLKPVGKEELIGVLTKALSILEKREALAADQENRTRREHKVSSFLEDSEYSALLSQRLYGRPGNREHVSSTRTFSEIATVLVKFYNIAGIAASFHHDLIEMSWSIKTRLRGLLGNEKSAAVFNYTGKRSEFLIAANADARELQAFAGKIREAFPIEEYGTVSVVVHDQASSLDDIGTVYREMIAVLVTRPFEQVFWTAFCPGEKGKKPETAGRIAPVRMEEELYHLLTTGKKGEAFRLVGKTMDFEEFTRGGWSFLEVKQYVGRVTGVAYRYVREKSPALLPQVEEMMDALDYSMKMLDGDGLKKTLALLLDSLWEKEDSGGGDQAADQLEQIYHYIEANYFENITLTSLAEMYHMDASYLSRVFSRKYGESVIAFLTRTRMEQAAKLLRVPDKKLETISFLVGYDDYNYFSRVFREKMGVSPTEYRSKMCE